MSKRRAASSNEGNGHGSAVDTSRKDLASSKPNATRRRDRNNVGAIVLSLLMAVAAITAIYWATTGGTRTKPAPPNVALRDLALQLMNPSKGILAADESPATLGKRLSSATLNTRTVRHNWRRTILTAAGLEEHISGVVSSFPHSCSHSGSLQEGGWKGSGRRLRKGLEGYFVELRKQ